MKEFTFAIDCDEVLRDILTPMLDVYNNEFGDNVNVSDFYDYKVEKVFPRIKAETGITASDYFFDKHANEVFVDANAINMAKEAIDTLRKYGKVYIVTYQKTYENRKQAIDWLEEHNIEYDGLFFSKDKTLIHADYMVDDNDWNFIGCNCNHGILISRPYNKNVSLSELKTKGNCKTIDRWSSIKAFADWFENNIEIFKRYE